MHTPHILSGLFQVLTETKKHSECFFYEMYFKNQIGKLKFSLSGKVFALFFPYTVSKKIKTEVLVSP